MNRSVATNLQETAPPAGYEQHVYAEAPLREKRLRLGFIVSHPIQYYVPLYQRLSARDDLEIKVFYTWHGADQKVWDSGFKQKIAWDLPLTEGYDYEVIPNKASDPGTHHFWGLRNPSLVERVTAWQPDALHLTGYAYFSHICAIVGLAQKGIPILFRGDSHLLSRTGGFRQFFKRQVVDLLFRYPSAFLYAGRNNRDYFRWLGVPDNKLFYCPHSIDFDRFANPDAGTDQTVKEWRDRLGLDGSKTVLLFSGKFERGKCPLELMTAIVTLNSPDLLLLMVGGGDLSRDVEALAADHEECFRTIPFQNQSAMPAIYRLADLLVLPSSFESWGLSVNEAMAAGLPCLVSDRVGCAADLIQPGINGQTFTAGDWSDFVKKLSSLVRERARLREMGRAAAATARGFKIQDTESGLLKALDVITGMNSGVCSRYSGERSKEEWT